MSLDHSQQPERAGADDSAEAVPLTPLNLSDPLLSGLDALAKEMQRDRILLTGSSKPKTLELLNTAYDALVQRAPSRPVLVGALLFLAQKSLTMDRREECARRLDDLWKQLHEDNGERCSDSTAEYAGPRVYWMTGELARLAGQTKEALDYLEWAIEGAQDQHQDEVLMRACISRAIIRNRQARARPPMRPAWERESRQDLEIAERIAARTGQWKVRVNVASLKARLELCIAEPDPIIANSLFLQSLDLVLNNSANEIAARLAARVCRSAIQNFFELGHWDLLWRWVQRAYETPKITMKEIHDDEGEKFKRISAILGAPSPLFAIGCAVAAMDERKSPKEVIIAAESMSATDGDFRDARKLFIDDLQRYIDEFQKVSEYFDAPNPERLRWKRMQRTLITLKKYWQQLPQPELHLQ